MPINSVGFLLKRGSRFSGAGRCRGMRAGEKQEAAKVAGTALRGEAKECFEAWSSTAGS